MLEIKNLKYEYEKDAVILNKLTVSFDPGKVHLVVGKNGSGKSTLFNLIARVLKPQEGQLLLNGKPYSPTEVAYLPHEPFFYPYMIGEEYFNLFAKHMEPKLKQKWQEAIQLPLDRVISEYSRGMKKKLALTCAIILKRPIIILDEPLENLDYENRFLFLELIRKSVLPNNVFIISSHSLDFVGDMCDEVYFLENQVLVPMGGKVALSVFEKKVQHEISTTMSSLFSNDL